MNWLQSIIYGLISGFSEFVPVSAQAHEAILRCLFGADSQPLLQSTIHLGSLVALTVSCRGQLARLRREKRLLKIPKKRRKRQPDMKHILESRLLNVAGVILFVCFLFYPKTTVLGDRLNLTAVFLLINGLILFLPQLLPSGNKDSRSLSRLDSVLLGVAGALGMIPGISRIGAMISAAKCRGADRQYALHLGLLLSIPAAAAILIFDIIGLVTGGLAGIGFVYVLQCLISGVAAYFGAYGAITLMRFLAVKTGYAAFAYYSWGAALFSFILFLTT